MTLKNSKSKPAKVVAIKKQAVKKEIRIKIGDSSFAIMKNKVAQINDNYARAKQAEVELNEFVTGLIEQSGNKVGKYSFDPETQSIVLG